MPGKKWKRAIVPLLVVWACVTVFMLYEEAPLQSKERTGDSHKGAEVEGQNPDSSRRPVEPSESLSVEGEVAARGVVAEDWEIREALFESEVTISAEQVKEQQASGLWKEAEGVETLSEVRRDPQGGAQTVSVGLWDSEEVIVAAKHKENSPEELLAASNERNAPRAGDERGRDAEVGDIGRHAIVPTEEPSSLPLSESKAEDQREDVEEASAPIAIEVNGTEGSVSERGDTGDAQEVNGSAPDPQVAKPFDEEGDRAGEQDAAREEEAQEAERPPVTIAMTPTPTFQPATGEDNADGNAFTPRASPGPAITHTKQVEERVHEAERPTGTLGMTPTPTPRLEGREEEKEEVAEERGAAEEEGTKRAEEAVQPATATVIPGLYHGPVPVEIDPWEGMPRLPQKPDYEEMWTTFRQERIPANAGAGVGTDGRKLAYCWYLTDPGYTCGARVMMQRLRAHGAKADFLVLYILGTPGMEEALAGLAADGDAVLREVDNLPFPVNARGVTHVDSNWLKKYKFSLVKLRALEQIDYDRLILIDSDAYVQANMDELFDVELRGEERIAAPLFYYRWERTMRFMPWFFVLTPSLEDFNAIKEEFLTEEWGNILVDGHHQMDGDIMNIFYRGERSLKLPPQYAIMDNEWQPGNDYAGILNATGTLHTEGAVHFTVWRFPWTHRRSEVQLIYPPIRPYLRNIFLEWYQVAKELGCHVGYEEGEEEQQQQIRVRPAT